MRLATCALSAVLLSGCSWLGTGSQHQAGYAGAGGAYGANCAPTQGYAQGYNVQGYQGYDAACAGQGFGQGAYGQSGYGQAGYGAGVAGYGPAGGAYGSAGGAYGQAGGYNGVAGYGPAGGAYGQAGYSVGSGVTAGLAAQGIGGNYLGGTGYNTGVTTLGASAPYGAAYGQNVVGSQLSNGQYVNGQYVQNVQGAPIYVPQPYGVPYAAGFAAAPVLRGGSAALPIGFELFGGTEFDIDGTAKRGKERSPSDPGNGTPSPGVAGEFDNVSFSDAFGDGYNLGGAVTYDVSRNTTLLASGTFSEKSGRTVDTGSFISGTFADPANPTLADFTPDVAAVDRDLEGSFSDLRQYTLEGGVRQYVGNNYAFRPYVGATGGFTYNNNVDVTQNYTDTGEVFAAESEFIDSGWRPTASGVIGAEMAVGQRAAVGVETGIRWRDGFKGDQVNNDDRFSIPVSLRGRVSF